MNFRHIILPAILLASALHIAAQNESKAPENNTPEGPGWLWEISGNGLTQTSYLFGTCHGEGHNFTREEVFGISGLQNAFDRSEAVIFEQDFDASLQPSEEDRKFQRWMVDLLRNPGPEWMMPEGSDYRQLYDDSTHFHMVDSILTTRFQDGEYWKKTPKYWQTKIGVVLFIATRQRQALDYVLYQEAAKSNKTRGGLEETKDISGGLISTFTDTPGFDSLSVKMQADSLYKSIRDIVSGKTGRMMRRFYKAYIQNDTCAFAKYLASEPELIKENEKDTFLVKGRNENWIPVIREYITQRPSLIAVGCRHLMGPRSVIALLRREGYTVEPVKKE